MFQTLSCFPPLGRLAPQVGMVPAEDTPILKSVGVTLGCQSIVDNDINYGLTMLTWSILDLTPTVSSITCRHVAYSP